MKEHLEKEKELALNTIVFFICLVLYMTFNVKDLFQALVSIVAFLVIIPALYVKFVLGKKMSDFGLQVGSAKRGITWAILSILISFILVFLFMNYVPQFMVGYKVPRILQKTGFENFIAYEVLLTGTTLFAYEFIYRGFLMSSLREKLRRLAVPAQFLLFIGFLLATQSPLMGHLLYIVAAFFSGIIAYKTKSIWYSFAYSWIFFLTVDVFMIARVQYTF